MEGVLDGMKYRLIAALAACAVLLTGCSGISGVTDKTEETQETRNVYLSLPLPDLFVEIPEDYQETSSEFYDKYYIKDDASIIITEDKEKGASMSAQEYRIDAINQYEGMTHSLEMIGSDTLTASYLNVEILEFTYTLAEDMPPLTSMVGFTSDGNSVFILTCKCPSEHYDEHRDEFLSVLQSVRIDRLSKYPTTENPETNVIFQENT